MLSRLEELPAASPAPEPEEDHRGVLASCHGGQRRAAEYLLARGADINGIPDYARQAAIDIAVAPETRRGLLATGLREHGARPADQKS